MSAQRKEHPSKPAKISEKDNDEEMAKEQQENIFIKANLLHLTAAKISGTL